MSTSYHATPAGTVRLAVKCGAEWVELGDVWIEGDIQTTTPYILVIDARDATLCRAREWFHMMRDWELYVDHEVGVDLDLLRMRIGDEVAWVSWIDIYEGGAVRLHIAYHSGAKP